MGVAKGHPMKLPRRQLLKLAAGVAALPAVARVAWVQTYPTHTIRLVVPFPPGGVFDAIGRPLAEKMRPTLGSVVVENIGGGGSSLGAAAVARARPDGYTILLGGTQSHIIEAVMKSRPQYNPVKDLDPIVNVATTTFAIAVHPAVPVHNLKELVVYAKANAGKVSFGSAGAGTLNHLTGESLKMLAGLPDLTHVPYRGAGPALTDLISGQIPMIIPAMTGQVLEFHKAGKLRILAVVSPSPLIGVPELPTAVEQGFPSLVAQQFIGLLAPAGTPNAIINQITQATHVALTDREYLQTLIESGLEPDLDSSPEKFRRSLEDDIARWTPIVNAIGLKLD
jgi:tripartite-type tricarboxylate transporter receptor subunit TctC